MKSLKLVGVVFAFLGLFDHWSVGKPDPFTIAFFPNPQYYGLSITFNIIFFLLLLLILVILPTLAFRGQRSVFSNSLGLKLSALLIVYTLLHLFFAYFQICIDSCEVGPGPTYGPVMQIIGFSIFAYACYRKSDLNKTSKS